MTSPHFLRFLLLTPPSLSPILLNRGLWSKITFWQIPPKWVTSLMDGPMYEIRHRPIFAKIAFLQRNSSPSKMEVHNNRVPEYVFDDRVQFEVLAILD